jgi:uncharacterized protein (TIGR02996 family)
MSTPEQLDETVWRPVVLAFLRDIKAHPGDDTPRLILADWLEEHGDPVRAARGEFLRLQTRAVPAPAREREKELLGRYEKLWLGPLANLARTWSWHRGLLHLEIQAAVLLDDPGGLARSETFAWVEGVTFRDLTSELVARLIAAPWLGWLNTLDLGYNAVGNEGTANLAASPYLTDLRSLWLRRNHIGDRGAAALAVAPGLTNLEVLSLVDNDIRGDGARALAISPHLSHLTLLNLAGNRIGGQALAALERAARAHPRLWLHTGWQH